MTMTVNPTDPDAQAYARAELRAWLEQSLSSAGCQLTWARGEAERAFYGAELAAQAQAAEDFEAGRPVAPELVERFLRVAGSVAGGLAGGFVTVEVVADGAIGPSYAEEARIYHARQDLVRAVLAGWGWALKPTYDPDIED